MKRRLNLILSVVLILALAITTLGFASIAVKSIKLNNNNISMQVGETYSLKISFTPSNTTQKQVKFSTENKNIATVDKYGKIKGIIPGKTVVTVTSTSNSKVVTKCNITILQTKINEIGNSVSNIDEMPSWTGKKLNLSIWMAHGNNATEIGKKATNDVFRPELERVTGIKFSTLNSFDNNGESADARMAKLIATNSWPDIGINLTDNIKSQLIKANKIYDLTDVIKEYAVNYMSIVNSSNTTKELFEAKLTDGKLLGFPYVRESYLKYADKNYDPQKYLSVVKPVDTRDYIWVRDDIIKNLYPNAKSMNEIENTYVNNGKFTKTDMTDITIKSFQDLRDLLVKINNLKLTEGNRKVWPFYTHNGSDNWDLLTCLNGSLNGMTGNNASGNCFTYFDVEQNKIVATFKQNWFKDSLKFYTNLIWDGLASRESIVDSRAAFDQKKNNGEYAIIYGINIPPPTDAVLKQGGKSYRYRKVMIDIPLNTKRFVRLSPDAAMFGGWNITLFKNKIKQNDLEQVVRFLDFTFSEAGMKFAQWGSKKAGLFVENSDGTRKFTDPKMEADVFSNAGNNTFLNLGRDSWPSLTYFLFANNSFNAKIIYPESNTRNPGLWSTYWNYGLVEKAPVYPIAYKSWDVWNYFAQVPETQRFWNARQAFEDELKMIFTAKNEQEFEKLYNNMVELAERNGLNNEAMKDVNKYFNEANPKFLGQLKNYK